MEIFGKLLELSKEYGFTGFIVIVIAWVFVRCFEIFMNNYTIRYKARISIEAKMAETQSKLSKKKSDNLQQLGGKKIKPKSENEDR